MKKDRRLVARFRYAMRKRVAFVFMSTSGLRASGYVDSDAIWAGIEAILPLIEKSHFNPGTESGTKRQEIV